MLGINKKNRYMTKKIIAKLKKEKKYLIDRNQLIELIKYNNILVYISWWPISVYIYIYC